jgi:hypothetical protein
MPSKSLPTQPRENFQTAKKIEIDATCMMLKSIAFGVLKWSFIIQPHCGTKPCVQTCAKPQNLPNGKQ